MTDSKNNKAWELIFNKYRIINEIKNNQRFIITAEQIKEFREPRLMTKFDYKSQLPTIFSKNNLSILPISRGSYVVSHLETFKKFDKNKVAIQEITDFQSFDSIDYQNISSESVALNCAYLTKMIDIFTENDDLKLTVSGRMSSSCFSFNINSNNGPLEVAVNNSQIEIDGGFEGQANLILIEVKNSISEDFIIRQLYYPYRLWSEKIGKKVRNLFLTYTNGIFHFREYVFEDGNHYNSIQLVNEKKYTLKIDPINIELIQKICNEIKIIEEPKVPFPQADSFERVINLCELLYQHDFLGKKHITEHYDFNERQTDYYTNAGRYLGLIDKNNQDRSDEVYFSLTEKGKNLFKLSISNRQLEFVKLILSHLVFRKTLEIYFHKKAPPTKNEIIEVMKKSNLYKINAEKTFDRRASTVLGWINWILGLIEE